MNEYIIYASWMANILQERGFKMLRTGINPKKPQFNTYIFEDTPTFQNALNDINNQYHKAKEKAKMKIR